MDWKRFALAAALAASPLAGAAAPDEPGVIKLEIWVGQDASISGGPVREFMCDDGTLVRLEFVDDGVAMKGLRPGTTLCSYRDAASMKRIVRVIVRQPPPRPTASP
jgi:hypothetical protein